ncbi:MAG: TIGR00725 family protein [Desulfohalobiaceae bacterium]|nr:TIGR00725 family protein [Desulfohalobiaceae bacterium]
MRISVIGAGECAGEIYGLAREVGRILAERGHILVCGGMGGVMEAASKGACLAGGQVIGILPGSDPREANPFVTCAVTTEMGIMRNYLVVQNGGAAIALSGGYGTLSEIGMALKLGRKVLLLGGWKQIDGVQPVASPEEAVDRAQAR